MAANTTSTSIVDLMSSPDPLSEYVPSSAIPSSRRITRSQASQRFFALGTSPKKQTFELDVGNEISPQKILVTVEAEDASDPGVKRRLFQSPTPKRPIRRKEKATTTTVPLRGLTDDEHGVFSETSTPRRRGMPPKAGTPVITRRRRPATPGQKPGSEVRSKSVSSRDVLQSDTSVPEYQATPRAGSGVRRIAKRKTISPAKSNNILSSQSRKRGRPRKQVALPDDVAALSEQESTADAEVEDNISVAPTDDNASNFGDRDVRAPQSDARNNTEEDIWMATLSDQATPVARQWQGREEAAPGSVEQALPEPTQPQRPQSEADYSQPEDYMDYGAMGRNSDAESVESGNVPPRDGQDTVMAGEEFTMISIGSLSSMQPNSSLMAPQQQELGEETSLIINRTLEYLRQSRNKSAEEAAGTQMAGADADEVNLIQQQEPSLFSQPKSPQPWTRSPRRAKVQPLVRQVALKNLHQGDTMASPDRTSSHDNTEAQDTTAYEDSFSEIPEAILAAATPRRLRQAQPEEEEDAAAEIQPSIERPSTTPSPIPSDDGDGDKSQKTTGKPASEGDIRSSPPVLSPNPQQSQNEAQVRHSRSNSTETPAEQLSSFHSSVIPPVNAEPINLAPPEPQPRPTLSPIVRAGRALQFITSDPPSPPGRGSVLRSPFRGSVALSSQSPALSAARATQSPSVQAGSPARPTERSWLAPFTQIKEFVVQGAQAFSPRHASVAAMEDPFGPTPSNSSRPTPYRASLFGPGSKQGQDQEAHNSITSPARAASLHGNDYDEMSWQAEETPSKEPSHENSTSFTSSVHAAQEALTSSADQVIMQAMLEEDAVRHSEQAEEQKVPDSRPDPEEDQNYHDHHDQYLNVNQDQDADQEIEQEQAQQYYQEERPRQYYQEQQLEQEYEEEQIQQDYQVEEIQEEEVQDEVMEEEEEEDDDIWAIEAQRPTPFAAKPAPAAREPVIIPPRRSKLPSPWRKNSRRLVYSDELHQLSESPAARSELEEYSLLSRQSRQEQAAAPANPAPQAAPAPSKVDLSTFFSSPAVLPDAQAPAGFGLFKALDGKLSQKPIVAQQQQSFGPLRPQMAARFERPQSFGNGLFPQHSPLFQTQTQTHQSPSPPARSIPQKEFHVERANRDDSLLSPVRRDTSRDETSSVSASIFVSQYSSPATPERSTFAHVPQKMNFTPRSRQAAQQNSLFNPAVPTPSLPANSLFGSNNNHRVPGFSFATSAQNQRGSSEVEEELEESYAMRSPDLSFEPPQLKPLPDRAASPSKSNIRSPVKPKTPGRVVEFTSSTLSPLAQAQARAERRASASPEKELAPPPPPQQQRHPVVMSFSSSPSSATSTTSNNGNRSPQHGTVASGDLISEHDKENYRQHQQQEEEEEEEELSENGRITNPSFRPGGGNVSGPFVSFSKPMSAAPLPKPAAIAGASVPRLSQTQWTRDHWLRLDELLQARRKGTLQFQLTLRTAGISGEGDGARKRHPLLGKQVEAQGETMTLERWHLDIVEAFRRELAAGAGGAENVVWTDDALAKRLFALMVGEERRREGRVDRVNRGLSRATTAIDSGW
ncbi:hypothetical protein B0H66DRAFT_334713 [Apodospora peruviana]|uniref:Uncharacterized protein n=1 Tax=Apodospora peruviana TaxID=516989 RepID=A0AAE0HY71_9PEZI|nr:hypothetical protein B0H66DRAFT_334713 [Apodospora peruviana]